ncbi:MAG: GNAT family N-acetyltransferase [Desulfobacterales bacterium]|nr:GNAT family N-acetyltransferase [Desulfobacterales bacterium]
MEWKKNITTPEKALSKIRPGMSIFIGTGASEPRTMVKHLMASERGNLQDLELIQLLSFGDAISIKELRSAKYRLKTFYYGWVATEAITEGRVDLIPSRFSRIPLLFEGGQIHVDTAIVQITPPDSSGYCSLGVTLDVARQAMEQAALKIGEVNPLVPRTFGDTFVNISKFDMLVKALDAPHYFSRWPEDEVFDKIAANIAPFIEDRSCIAFSIGPLFEALGKHLAHKKDLGIHSPFFTDALMDLVRCDAVTNRYKEFFRGKSLASYALGTPELMTWLDQNPLVEFQGIDKVYSPAIIGCNPKFVAVHAARKVGLSGHVALHTGKGIISAGPAEIIDFFYGAEISTDGRTFFALPSRNLEGRSNIIPSIKRFDNQLSFRESVEMVATEYGVANLSGKTIRERAQALIDIAHPDDRQTLIDKAKEKNIIYRDQIFFPESARLYPGEVDREETFKGGIHVRFRAILPSDEDQMRRLFYRFSDKAVYTRYFSSIKSMPHARMQEYVNVDWNQVMSIVGLVGKPGQGRIIAEARYLRETVRPFAEVAFIVDEEYQNLGISTYMYKLLVELAKKHHLVGFTAEVLFSNISMMKVFKKGNLPVKANLENGVYHITIPFE